MELKISTNALKVSKALGGIDEILKRSMAETLRQTSQYVLREGARQIVAARFAPGLKISDIYANASQKKLGNQGMVSVDVRANQHMDWWKQEAYVTFSARTLRAKYFSPVTTVHNTRYGVRYGVSVVMGGVRKETGGFRLRGQGANMSRIDGATGAWDNFDWVFVREANNKIRPYWFASISDILRRSDGEARLEAKYIVKMEGYLLRNFNRYSLMVWREFNSVKI